MPGLIPLQHICGAGWAWGAAQRPQPQRGRAPALAQRLFPAAGPVPNPHLCEGYAGADGRYHPGFSCPRLTDPDSHRYCCRPGPLKSCCSQLALEALTGVNLSSLAGPGLLRNPLALPFVGLYGLLIVLLMALDLFHFYRTRRRRISRRLLPCARRPPRTRGGPPPPAPGRAC
ncbi:protein shisa-like-1a [Colius striatus]|uniref:protein shisa-like-1a n=1 Tax=Colius striatus TaxID=57412 RepID=UPI002B1DB525|nr:protein shisa-like-1a [Colius striatus]